MELQQPQVSIASTPESRDDLASAPLGALNTDDYSVAYGEPLSRTLDLNTWHPGADLLEMYERLQREVADAVRLETELQASIRRNIFPYLRAEGRPNAPKEAGVYRASTSDVEAVHLKLLFNGGVEACYVFQ